jgi:hypothetical protein
VGGLQFPDSGIDIEADLAVNRNRLHCHRAIGAAGQYISTLAPRPSAIEASAVAPT